MARHKCRKFCAYFGSREMRTESTDFLTTKKSQQSAPVARDVNKFHNIYCKFDNLLIFFSLSLIFIFGSLKGSESGGLGYAIHMCLYIENSYIFVKWVPTFEYNEMMLNKYIYIGSNHRSASGKP